MTARRAGALIPVAHEVDALVALAIVAVACCGLIAYEAIRFRDARDRVRHTEEMPRMTTHHVTCPLVRGHLRPRASRSRATR